MTYSLERPMDDFERDDNHRAFQLALERMGRLAFDASFEPGVSVVAEPAVSRTIEMASPQVTIEKGNVIVKLGRKFGVTLSYSERKPDEFEVVGDNLPERVVEAVRSLHGASLRTKNRRLADEERRMAIFAQAEAAGILLECGRPDLTQGIRRVFDQGLPGVSKRGRIQ